MLNRCLTLSLLLIIVVLCNAPFSVEAGPGWPKFKKLTKIVKRGESEDAKKVDVVEVPQPEPTPAPTPANGSLYTEGAVGADVTNDFKPRRVGDLVFVDVIEASTASVSSGAKRSRDSGTVGGLTTTIGALPGASAATAATVAGALGNRKYEGSGSTQRATSLKARIAARVIEVMPNGDLVIEARKMVRINSENETLRMSGIIRRRDVTADNAVPTTSIGNLFVELNGKGIASADNAPGWLFRFFDKINPF